MKWWCPECGCPMKAESTTNADGSAEVAVSGCHCGTFGTTNVKPKGRKRTAKCPAA